MLRVQPTALRQLQSRLEKRRYPGGLRASESSGDAIPTLSVGGSKSDLAIVSALAAAPRLSLERRFEAVEALKGLKTAQGREALEEVVTRNKEDIAERVRTSQMEKFTQTCELLAKCETASACTLLRAYASFRGNPYVAEAVVAGHTLARMASPDSDCELRSLLTTPLSYLNGVYGAARGLSERYDSDPIAQAMVKDLVLGGKGTLSAQREIVNFIAAQTQRQDFWGESMRSNLSEPSLALLRDMLSTGASSEVTSAAACGLADNISRCGRAYSIATECVGSNKVSVSSRITILHSLWENKALNQSEVTQLARAFATSTTAPKEPRDFAASLLRPQSCELRALRLPGPQGREQPLVRSKGAPD